MSFKAAAWAVEQRVTSTPAQKLVLIALADAHNGQTGRCDPSIQRVAELCHMSYRTITRTLTQLEELGLISREKRTDGNKMKVSNRYKLSIGHGVPSIGHPRQKDRSNATPPDRTQCPINQEVRNREENQEPGASAPEGLDWEVWERWLEYRKQIRKPLKPVSIPAAQRKLAAMGPDQAEAVNRSIANGWQGLFEPTGKNPEQAKKTSSLPEY